MVEVMKIMATSFRRSHAQHCCTQCSQPCSRPLPSHASSRDSWTLTGKSGSVSCGVTAPFSRVVVCSRFCLCPPGVCSPFLCKVYVGLIGPPPRGFMQYPGVLHPEPQLLLFRYLREELKERIWERACPWEGPIGSCLVTIFLEGRR